MVGNGGGGWYEVRRCKLEKLVQSKSHSPVIWDLYILMMGFVWDLYIFCLFYKVCKLFYRAKLFVLVHLL